MRPFHTMSAYSAISSAKNTIRLQAESIAGLGEFLNNDFENAVQLLATCKGRIVISGIGKSAIVAQKVVATMNSTGSPALFMHAGDAIHGDLGMIQQDDVVIVISKSGDSPEVKVLAPLVKSFGNKLIAIVGNIHSYLAQQCDIIINSTIQKEACPNNLAPTTSTTAQMVMGDALAICLMEARGFNTGDFARYHPGGALGKRLYLRVHDILLGSEKPVVYRNSNIKEVIMEITHKRLGAAAVLEADGSLAGIITDGDIRRMLEKHENFSHLLAEDIMSAHPKKIENASLASEAMQQMQTNNISQLVVMNDNEYCGIIHVHALVKEGIM
ncbi:MAG: KpsF/GutQ family sugar-phosphate isomerase [Ferruginibacter sp.]